MISKDEALKGLREYHNQNLANLIYDNALRIKRGSYEYVFDASHVNYIGDGSEFLIIDLSEATNFNDDSPLEFDDLTLGGRDFQISGRVFESAEDMIVRRKIFELYESQDLNVSLYSSGAGKNLDLLVNCGGTFDNYSEPAILEREYSFALKWLQETGTLKLYIDGEEVYSVTGSGFTERRSFSKLLIGGSLLHEGATFKGSVSDLKVYDGFCEG